MRDAVFSFTINTDFRTVMKSCQTIKRIHGVGSWIQDEMVEAYTQLHHLGYAHSAEAWFEGKLAGGLYGIKIGKVFFGESMFSNSSNASKFAFVKFVHQLVDEGVKLIDCQQQTAHLMSFGAEMISRELFIKQLNEYCQLQ